MDKCQPSSASHQLLEGVAHENSGTHGTPSGLGRAVNDTDCTQQSVAETFVRLKSAAFDEIRALRLPDSTTQDVLQAIQRAVEQEERKRIGAPPPQENGPTYALRFKHDCQALGCTQSACDLCEANPRRRCTTDFDKKYFKGDVIKARCGGSIYVEVIDQESGECVMPESIASNAMIELSIIDGNKYEQLFPHGGFKAENMTCLESCMLVFGNEGRPLLQSDDRAHNRDNGKVHVPVQSPKTNVCDLRVHCSSEALLSGRRPPFRLLARYLPAINSAPIAVLPALSTNFIVASGRSRQSQKKRIPFADDPVSRLENMGKERVKKLGNLRITAKEMSVDLPRREHYRICTVADFKKLALDADTDGQLKQKILHMLKMSEKAWEEARDHAACCIKNDTRMRAWYRTEYTDLQGLAYLCYMGETDIHKPIALLIHNKIVLREYLDTTQRDLMKDLQVMATEAWEKPNHPGWIFFNFDSEEYKKEPTTLASIGQLRSDHHSRKWPIGQQSQLDSGKNSLNPNNDQCIPDRNPKRLKKNTAATLPPSPPSPKRIRSPYETECLAESPEALPPMGGHQANTFQTSDGPVIPRAPPESPFTRPGGHRNNEIQRIPDSSVLEHFYITTTPSSSNVVSSRGADDVYAPLKTPFEKWRMGSQLKKQMTQLQFQQARGEDPASTNATAGHRIDPQNLVALNMNHADAGLSSSNQSDGLLRSPASQLSWSIGIESLSPSCNAAILEGQHIWQMSNRCGHSNQYSFEGGKRHGRSSPTQQSSDGPFVVAADNSTSQAIVQEPGRQLNNSHQGMVSYGIVLVPFPSEQQQDPNPHSRG